MIKKYFRKKATIIKKLLLAYKNNILLAVLINFILGVCASSNIFIAIIFILANILVKPKVFIISFCSFLFGFIYCIAWFNNINNEIIYVNKQNQNIFLGQIIEPVEIKGNSQVLVLNIDNFQSHFITTIFSNIDFKYGDIVELKTSEINILDNSTYNNYLRSKNIYIEVQSKEITKSKNSNILSFTGEIRSNLILRLANVLNSQSEGLINGILFGKKENLTDEFESQLITTGTSHIISASGSNILFFFLFIEGISLKVKKSFRILLSIFFVSLYLFMIGITILPALRAFLMINYIVIGKIFGRKINYFLGVCLSITVVIFINPTYIFNVSFLLSALSSIGIFYLSPIYRLVIHNIPKDLKNIGESFVASTSAYISTLPISIIVFNSVSAVAIIANTILVPFVPIISLFGFITLIATFTKIDLLITPISKFVDMLANIFIKIIEFISLVSNYLNFGSITILILILSILFFTLYFDYKNETN